MHARLCGKPTHLESAPRASPPPPVGLDERRCGSIENRLRRIEGVESIQANPRTGNVLIHYDRQVTDEKTLLAELDKAWASIVKSAEWGAGSENLAAPHASPLASHSTAIRVGVRGLLGHAVVDSLWFGAGFLGSTVGLPLAGLGPLHVLMDIAIWMMAFQSGVRNPVTSPAPRMPSESVGDDGKACGGAGELTAGSKLSRSPQR